MFLITVAASNNYRHESCVSATLFSGLASLNPIPIGQGWNQPLYERHVTKSGRNRVKSGFELLMRHLIIAVF